MSETQAKRWERLARLPQEDFEQAIAAAKSPSTKGLLKATWTPVRKPEQVRAISLLKRLRVFESDLFDHEPADVLAATTPAVRADICALAPRVAAWLDRFAAELTK